MTAIDRCVEELATKQHGLFTTRQVLLRGGTQRVVDHRVATGRWSRESYGVLRLVGAPSTDLSSLMGIVLSSGTRAVVSHRSAAALHRLPGFSTRIREVTYPSAGRMDRRDGVVMHRSDSLPLHHRTVVDGLPVTTPARCLLELTAVVPVGRAARAMDTALATSKVRYVDLVSILGELTARGRRRTRIFRMLLAERGPLYVPPASELERRFAGLIESIGESGWRRQVDLGGADGWIGRVDVHHQEKRLVVEVDGAAAHSSFLDRVSDQRREAALVDAGFRVVRFGWAEVVGNPDAVRTTIRELLSDGSLPHL